MNYEKAYKEALERAKKELQTCGSTDCDAARQIFRFFPELKESEDERIRKELLQHCLDRRDGKQICVDASDYRRWAVWLEKQGEQKPTEKVEPEFKVGDWIINGEYLWQITNIDRLDCTMKSQNGDVVEDNINYIDNEFHLWTIQDAKDGDVLGWDNSKCIALFKNIYDEDSFNSHGFVGHCTGTFESGLSYHDIEGAHPVTKEQRDVFFQKMKEAGYEWNSEKKELKKIDARENLVLDGDLMQADCMIVEQNPAWSEDDEESCKRIIDLLYCTNSSLLSSIKKNIDWLKSIKGRVQPQPKQEWDAQDEAFLGDAIHAAKNTYSEKCGQEELIDWLKSFKPNHWKPSEEEMNDLYYAAKQLSVTRPSLKTLYEHLKTL